MVDLPITATGLLRTFCEARMLRLVDFHLARRIGQLAGEADEAVLLAIALTVRALRHGSVCLDVATAEAQLLPEDDVDAGSAAAAPEPLPWPEARAWLAALAASPAVGGPEADAAACRLDGTLLYLDRYWRQERRLADLLRARSALTPIADPPPLPPEAPERPLDEHQRHAVAAALAHRTTVITGGPGTGKTTIVRLILEALAPDRPRVALCAPTGKAAARLRESVAAPPPGWWSGTIYRLLGTRPRTSAVEFGPGNPLPFDVVIVDETSMGSMEIMRALVDAVPPEARLILLGDPHQLRSVDAGAVLADIEAADDLVSEPGGAIARLRINHRSNPGINALADAILAGDVAAARAALDASSAVRLIDFDPALDITSLEPLAADVLATATEVQRAALDGDGAGANQALGRHRILCGHREGPFGVGHWARSLRTWLRDHHLRDYGFDTQPYPGQPLLVTRNAEPLYNGDTAVVVRRPGGELMAAVDRPGEVLWFPPALLDHVADLHAMTVHKSQGSQFSRVSVVLPPLGSRMLTRELVYTAVTRAQDAVRLYGSWEALAQAIVTPVQRASGLG